MMWQRLINVELPVEKYDTFSGFVCGVLERVPEDGEQFRCSWKNLDIVVESGQKPYRCGGNRSCSAREKSAGTERRDLTKPCSAGSWDSYREEDFGDLWTFSNMLLLERVLFL